MSVTKKAEHHHQAIKPVLHFKQVDPRGPSVSALMGDGFAIPSASGGWEVVQRPKRKGFINWAGKDPISMDLPIVLDGFKDNKSVEHSIATFEHFLRDQVGVRDEPPVIQVTGMPIPHQGKLWVVNGLGFGTEEIRRRSDGHRVRCALTVSLLEHITPDLFGTKKSHAKQAQDRQKQNKTKSGGEHWTTSSSGHTYVVKKGDTLRKIAKKELGDGDKWHIIKQLNNLRDPDAIKVGQRLKMP
jgi:hypothetical protein